MSVPVTEVKVLVARNQVLSQMNVMRAKRFLAGGWLALGRSRMGLSHCGRVGSVSR